MLLHTGGSTRGWGESVCESSRSHLKNASSFTWMQTQVPQTIPFIPREAGTARACPANSPTGICAPRPGPGQLSHGRSHSRQSRWQWTRGRKYSQKQLAKALAQPAPCLYLLRWLDLVQILEKKNRKCFTCYLIWSSCWEQFLVPQDRSHREGWRAAARRVCGARQSTFPVPQGFHTAWPLPSAKYSHFCYFTCP